MAADYIRMDARLARVGGSAVEVATPGLLTLIQQESVDRALRRVVRNVATLISANTCTLAIHDPERHELVVTHTTTITPTAAGTKTIPLQQGLMGVAATQRQLVVVDDLLHEPRYAPTDGRRLGSLLCVPLVEEGILLGVIVAASERVHAFGLRHIACAEALADTAVLVLARARQTHEAESDRRQLRTLVDAARSITKLLEPREVFENIAGGIQHIVEYDDAIIFAYDSMPNELQVVASRGQRSAHLCAQRVSMTDAVSLSVRVARQRQALLYTPDVAMERPGHITEAFLAGEDLALLCVPLLSKDQLRGVVTLARQRPFIPDDVRAMSDLAPLVATALENVALYASIRAEQAAKMQVLQMISHEIRSPLHTLNGYLDLALANSKTPLDERQNVLLQRARASGERLATQVRDLLLLAHDEVGALAMQMTTVDVARIIKEAIDALEIAANERGVFLHLTLPPALPPITGDGERLRQVARNLLDNALAFTPRNGHIWVEARVGSKALELWISDTGCGISAEHLPRIFERFYRVPAEPGKASSHGQGLGLAIVKTIVERHGGRVQVLSTPGQGSRFMVSLPLITGSSDVALPPMNFGTAS
jgi:signal transduction histidine kinase